MGIYMGDLLYCAYSRLLPKPSSFLSSSSSDSSWTFLLFITCFPLQSFAMCSSLSHLKHFLVSAFLCHMSVLVVVKAFRLSVFKVAVGPPNIYWLSSSTICYSSAHLVIVAFFCWFISLSNWCYCHFPLLEWLWHGHGWVCQYRFDNILLYVLL